MRESTPHGFEGTQALVLIGPIAVGKTTVGRLVAARVGCAFTSLDDHELEYTTPAGFDRARYDHLAATEGIHAEYAYRRGFFAAAVRAFLAARPAGVLELGGGHPVVPDPAKQARVAAALAPYPRVVLLMPSPDAEESLAFLDRRLSPPARAAGFNRLYLADDTFFRLAKTVVYTAGLDPEAVADQVLEKCASIRPGTVAPPATVPKAD